MAKEERAIRLKIQARFRCLPPITSEGPLDKDNSHQFVWRDWEYLEPRYIKTGCSGETAAATQPQDQSDREAEPKVPKFKMSSVFA